MEDRDSKSVSLTGLYSWEDVDNEATRIKKGRSHIIQKGVNLYFLEKNRTRIKTNYTHIVLGILLVLESFNFVFGVII